jgi:UDP-N-acetylmuramyl pentapeptide synthase
VIDSLRAGDAAVVPAGERLLDSHLREELEVVTFGDSGDVRMGSADGERIALEARGRRVELEVPFTQAHLRTNLRAAVAVGSP